MYIYELLVLSFQFVDDEPGMSFSSGSGCPQASQIGCDRYFNLIKLP